VRTILSEWARLGGTKVVGGEKITGAPLTLQLENVPEAQALEILLRNVAGYMAAPRQASSTGASAYDRILVMPTSAAAASAASNRPSGGNGPINSRNGRGAFGTAPAQQPEQEVAVQPVQEEQADTGVNEPFQFPQQNPFQAIGQPGPFGTPVAPQNGAAQPPVISFGQGTSQGVSVNPTPDQPTPTLTFPGMPNTTTPNGGFGVVGAPTPGVILQPAPQPGQPTRPPGGD
jgi:hypothetical protein